MILFFSDPHVGVNRRANTTDVSRKKLAHKTVYMPEHNLQQLKGKNKVSKVVCAGDLFDKFSNKEDVILEARHLMKHVDFCLAGNHDQINDSTKKSSLEVIESIRPDSTISCKTGERLFHVEHDNITDTTLYLVPHHSSQDLMEQTLEAVIAAAESNKLKSTKMLVVHCNYDIPQEISNDVTLNLSADDIQYLLDDVGIDYILMGHDHNSREMYEGRLRILGNTQPTSFSDIGDKFITAWDGAKFIKHPIWKTSERFKELNITKDWPELPDTVEFIDVVGSIAASENSQAVRRIQELWETYPNLLAVRNSVQLEEVGSLLTDEISKLSSSTVYDLIDSHIKHTDLYDLWIEMTKDLQNVE